MDGEFYLMDLFYRRLLIELIFLYTGFIDNWWPTFYVR